MKARILAGLLIVGLVGCNDSPTPSANHVDFGSLVGDDGRYVILTALNEKVYFAYHPSSGYVCVGTLLGLSDLSPEGFKKLCQNPSLASKEIQELVTRYLNGKK